MIALPHLIFLSVLFAAGFVAWVTDRRRPGLLSDTVVAFGGAVSLGLATGWVIGALA